MKRKYTHVIIDDQCSERINFQTDFEPKFSIMSDKKWKKLYNCEKKNCKVGN